MPRIIVQPYYGTHTPLDASNVVAYIVDRASDCDDETTEELRKKLDALTVVVGLLAAELPTERLIALANAASFETFYLEQDQ